MEPRPIKDSGELFGALQDCGLIPTDQLREVPYLLRDRNPEPRSLGKAIVQRGWLSIYQLNQILAGRAKELVFGPYHILERLGQGGLSSVYKARHAEQGWHAALKVIKPEALQNVEGKRQFLLEMEAMARLDHPNIVQFCDLDQHEETFYFAMEFVEGTDLGKLVTLGGPLNVNDACNYIHQAGLGLQHSHERNLVHRDIKPVNLFLTHVRVDTEPPRRAFEAPVKRERVYKPLIKILDWGLANLRSWKQRDPKDIAKEMSKGVIGTADWLSPEQAKNAAAVDIRADIYSLGCTMYYLLTGRPPFPDGNLVQKLYQHQTMEPKPIEKFRPDVPDGVLAILKRMLAKKPEDRFGTPAALALALAPFVKPDQTTHTRRPRLDNKVEINDNTPLPPGLDPPSTDIIPPPPRRLGQRLRRF